MLKMYLLSEIHLTAVPRVAPPRVLQDLRRTVQVLLSPLHDDLVLGERLHDGRHHHREVSKAGDVVQGGPSCRGKQFVDIRLKVPLQYKLLSLKHNSIVISVSTKGGTTLHMICALCMYILSMRLFWGKIPQHK